MPTGPKIKLDINLHRIDRYFPLDFDVEGGYDYDRIIDRKIYDDVAVVLKDYRVKDDQAIREFCFILGWIQRQMSTGINNGTVKSRYEQMADEIEGLKDYFRMHRIRSVTFHGELMKNKAGEDFTMREDINIDRICDGIRVVFREEFDTDKEKRRSKGLRAWQRRKMIRIRNNFFNYFTTIPELDELDLQEQIELIDKLSALAGIRNRE